MMAVHTHPQCHCQRHKEKAGEPGAAASLPGRLTKKFLLLGEGLSCELSKQGEQGS